MVFTAYDVTPGETAVNKWRVENSWGTGVKPNTGDEFGYAFGMPCNKPHRLVCYCWHLYFLHSTQREKGIKCIRAQTVQPHATNLRSCIVFDQCRVDGKYTVDDYGGALTASHPPQTSTIHHTIPYHSIPYRTIPYHTIPYHNTILHHTIPHVAMQRLVPFVLPT